MRDKQKKLLPKKNNTNLTIFKNVSNKCSKTRQLNGLAMMNISMSHRANSIQADLKLNNLKVNQMCKHGYKTSEQSTARSNKKKESKEMSVKVESKITINKPLKFKIPTSRIFTPKSPNFRSLFKKLDHNSKEGSSIYKNSLISPENKPFDYCGCKREDDIDTSNLQNLSETPSQSIEVKEVKRIISIKNKFAEKTQLNERIF